MKTIEEVVKYLDEELKNGEDHLKLFGIDRNDFERIKQGRIIIHNTNNFGKTLAKKALMESMKVKEILDFIKEG